MKVPQLVTFHATDAREEADIISQFGKQTRVRVISNFPASQDELSLPPEKEVGSLDALFIGCIHRIKGLDILLNSLKSSAQRIRLTIVGNPEDVSYLQLCKKLVNELPANVQVTFKNEVPHREIDQLIRDHHIFCLPTKGENFGHAIFESLAAGRPVLISDQTPWRNLIKYNAGWDLSLDNPAKFGEIIDLCALMKTEELNEWSKGAWQFCNNYLRASNVKQQYLNLFS